MNQLHNLKKVGRTKVYKNGFVALLSALIISTILLGASITLSSRQFYVRGGALNAEFKKESKSLASSCSNITLEKILYDYSYQPGVSGEVVLIGGRDCTISSVTNDVEDAAHDRVTTIITKANYKSSYSTLEVRARVHNPSYLLDNPAMLRIKILSWVEI